MTEPVLAVDIGGSHVSGALIEGRRYVPLLDWRRPPHSEAPDLAEFVGELLSRARPAVPVGVGIAVAGVVDPTHRRIVASENLGAVPSDLARQLERGTGIPVRIETDVFCFGRALAEDSPRGTQLLVAVGTGIGHCLIIDGIVLQGRGRQANRLGHMTVQPGGRECYCGRRGCLCQYSAGEALRDASRTTEGSRLAHELLARALGASIQLAVPDEIVLTGGPVTAGALDLGLLADLLTDTAEGWLQPPLRILSDPSAPYRGAALVATDHLHADHETLRITGRHQSPTKGTDSDE